MAGVVVPLAIALFLSGVTIGVYVVIAIAVRREDRANTLVSDASGWLSSSGRRLNGVGRRDLDPEFLRPVGELIH